MVAHSALSLLLPRANRRTNARLQQQRLQIPLESRWSTRLVAKILFCGRHKQQHYMMRALVFGCLYCRHGTKQNALLAVTTALFGDMVCCLNFPALVKRTLNEARCREICQLKAARDGVCLVLFLVSSPESRGTPPALWHNFLSPQLLRVKQGGFGTTYRKAPVCKNSRAPAKRQEISIGREVLSSYTLTWELKNWRRGARSACM